MRSYDGKEFEKPMGFTPTPIASHTIIPAQRPPIEHWGKNIRKELDAIWANRRSDVMDCELVVIEHYNQPRKS